MYEDQTRALAVTKTPVLLDIVGAMGLTTLNRTTRNPLSPYCIVYVDGEEVSRTKAIRDDGDPIWTIQHNSLCVISVSQNAKSQSYDLVEGEVTIKILRGSTCMGKVELSYDEALAGDGERREYSIIPVTANADALTSIHHRATLALRFRPATQDDIKFLKGNKLSRETEGLASDINFRTIQKTSLFQRNRKFVKDKEYIRAQPFPDPERPKETEWMTREEIEAETLKPSKRWVSAGHGKTGTIHLEILGCDGLPNTDFNVNDLSDPFVGIVFEDSMVRTDIIWDDLNPRWLPWTTRAFIFKVRHPTSILMLGVFDYDELPIDFHDPLGRVVINTSAFRCNTDYVLHYKLHHDPREKDAIPRGNIIIRLRINWEQESEAMKLSFTTAPQFLINVENVKSHHVLRYVTRGAIDMEQPTVDAVKLYFSELVSYWQNYCYVLDILMEIILWRGRLRVSATRTLWFPIHSLLLFAAVALVLERPGLAMPTCLYFIAWILLSVNYHASRHPYPWQRVKKSEEINMMALLGRSSTQPEKIEPGQGVQEKLKIERLDELKARRMVRYIFCVTVRDQIVLRAVSQTIPALPAVSPYQGLVILQSKSIQNIRQDKRSQFSVRYLCLWYFSNHPFLFHSPLSSF
jgi:hypothetical protein